MQNNFDVYWGFSKSDGSEDPVLTKKRKMSDIENSTKMNTDDSKYQIYDPYIRTNGRVIHFSAEIKKLTIEIFITHIYAIIDEFYAECELKDEDLEITYVVDSNGGSVSSVLKFVDFLSMAKQQYPRLKFKSVISGLTASAGTTMSCVADVRHMTKYAGAMIHDLSTNIGGSYTQIKSQSEYVDNLNVVLIEIYSEKCNRTKEQLSELLKTNKWFTAKQYLEYGFIDKIV